MKPVYEIQQVVHSYAGQPVLELERLSLQEGRIIALVGPNGAGKSTLLRLLGLVELPTSGRLRYRGVAVESGNVRALRRGIGWVMQQPYLVRGSVLDNVTLGLKFRKVPRHRRRQIAVSTLERLGFGAALDSPVNHLSGGQRQMVALARSLALAPETLLLDEPFTHLDPRSHGQLEDLLATLKGDGVTVIFSSHDLARARALADEVIALRQGQLVEAPAVNVFAGHCQDRLFQNGRIEIELAEPRQGAGWIAIDPRQIVISQQPLRSSMRNRFPGRVMGLHQESGCARVTVEAGERFEVLITQAAYLEMRLTLGQPLWINFKSTAIKILTKEERPSVSGAFELNQQRSGNHS